MRLQHALTKRNYLAAIHLFYDINQYLGKDVMGFRYFYEHLDQPDRSQVLEFFTNEGLKIIHLKRRNLLRQYLSIKIAQKTNIWVTSEIAEFEKISVNVDECIRYIKKSSELTDEHNRIFSHVNNLDVHYEDILQNREVQMHKIQDFLDIPRRPCNSPLKKINNKSLEGTIKNFQEVKCALEDTPWDTFLEDSDSVAS